MRMPELKSLARDRGLRNYSRMRKAELVVLLQNNPPPGQSRASAAPTPRTRPPLPPPPIQTWEPIDDKKPRKPSSQEMDIFEQQEMSKSRPQVKTKLNPIQAGGHNVPPYSFFLVVLKRFAVG